MLAKINTNQHHKVKKQKQSVVDRKDLFKAIHKSQHCNRNWNLEQSIPQEDIDLIVESVTQCPSKQNLQFYNIHIIQDRNIIESLHNATKGFTINEELITTNSQTLAHLVIVFEAANREQNLITHIENNRVCAGVSPEDIREEQSPEIPGSDEPEIPVLQEDGEYRFPSAIIKANANAKLEEMSLQTVSRDEHMAVGLAAGYANLTASLLGYSTGCCACFNPADIKEILNLQENALLIMGIGIPGNKNRRIHHLDDDIKFPTKTKQHIPVIVHSVAGDTNA